MISDLINSQNVNTPSGDFSSPRICKHILAGEQKTKKKWDLPEPGRRHIATPKHTYFLQQDTKITCCEHSWPKKTKKRIVARITIVTIV